MTNYRHLAPSPALSGSTAVAAGFAAQMAQRLHRQTKRREAARLLDWVEEGGSLAAPSDETKSS